MRMKILICAGGTGGGIYPALAAVTVLRQRGYGRENFLWVGAKGEMEETLVRQADLQLETITGGAIAGVAWPAKVVNGAKLAWSAPKAYRILRRFRPDVALMTGGYVAAPVTAAARLTGTPVVIFLPDVEPGQSIRFALPYAKKVGATTSGSAAYVPAEKLVVTGYPVRPELRQALRLSRAAALAQFDLKAERPTVFVFGGSRGAQAINRALLGILPALLTFAQVIHISGVLTWPEVAAAAEKLTERQKQFYRPFPYLHEEMGAAFRAADLVVARAGASMLGEGPAFGVPMILSPLTWAWRYQKVNADYLTERGAAVQLRDEQLPEKLLPLITSLLQDEARLARMRQAARTLDVPNGAENLADLVLAVAQGNA